MEKEISALKNAIKGAERVTVLTGAGISAESGVPTFRGEGGLWRNHDVMELATPYAFERDPELVWEFYNWRRDLISKLTFNPAHKALVDLERIKPSFTLISQNVDGLHLLAGSKNLLEIHGNLWKVRCTRCNEITLDLSPDMGPLPKCKTCGGLLRPHVVWFGESLDGELLNRAVDASKNCDIMLVIGTSSVVQPASSLAFQAKDGGAIVAEINLEATPNSQFMDFAFHGKAGEIVPRLLD
ncbi:MAG TPA: NAD-dependent deacylase [Desulfobacteraceae bacterium]|nr:NAD-dependent deacylase [Desulfobacteraceae bacterium]HPJ68751.1 NAD-dependent deacylase [Desulfobacteraceae bacterium]HPQ29975.1 NAD-dependent deacylase [Desulfobacteraceae bacterium]